ncbi:Uncharacterised protein [Klebsiella michiganensis]|uniref:Uncharacterized protein n=1 Tax=Klebsiella michiganensis TaxID=1134687 RepID=A0A7H4LWA7_9ENTR|nr:Uncharacterised protein [Klebsiella michiganensis]
MRALADDILFAALAVAEQGDQVGLGAARQEDSGLFARQVGGKALEFVNGRVIAIHVIPDRGGIMASSMARPGRVTVSLRKSIMSYPYTLHPSRCPGVGCTLKPRSQSYLCARGFSALPP